jgi:DNA-binding transcriptional LysR family regulator
MKRLVPPTHLLRAFLATAEHGGVARAADVLHLTPGAVSKQISELEKWLGAPLFERVRKRLVLTPAGVSYREGLLPVFKQLEAVTLATMRGGRAEGDVLCLNVMPSFSQQWLEPRLPRFNARHPEIALRSLSFVPASLDPASPGEPLTYPTEPWAPAAHAPGDVPLDLPRPLDAVIRYGRAPDTDLVSEYLVGRETVVIAPPRALLAHPLDRPDDLRHQALIHQAVQPDGWRLWCELHGLTGIDVHAGPRLTLGTSVMNAVAAGVGVALASLCLVADEIAQGLVSSPFPAVAYEPGGYYLCYRDSQLEHTPFVLLRAWLLDEAAAFNQQIR